MVVQVLMTNIDWPSGATRHVRLRKRTVKSFSGKPRWRLYCQCVTTLKAVVICHLFSIRIWYIAGIIGIAAMTMIYQSWRVIGVPR